MGLLIHEPGENEGVVWQIAVCHITLPPFIEPSKVIGGLLKTLELHHLIEVVKVCCPG